MIIIFRGYECLSRCLCFLFAFFFFLAVKLMSTGLAIVLSKKILFLIREITFKLCDVPLGHRNGSLQKKTESPKIKKCTFLIGAFMEVYLLNLFPKPKHKQSNF